MEQNRLPIQAVLFDYGMVLSGPPNPAAWANLRTISGLTEEGLLREYWAHRHAYDRGTHTAEAYWQLVAQGNTGQFSPAQIEQLIAADVDLWADPNPEMIAWAQQLQKAGVPTGILSNIGDAMAEGLVKRLPWLDAFHHHTWSYELKLAKPEQEIYHHAAAGLQVEPSGILFLDDRAENIEAARAVGMTAIQYRNHPEFVDQMRSAGFESLLSPELKQSLIPVIQK